MSRNVFAISYGVLWLVVLANTLLLVLLYRQVGLVYLGGRGRANLGGVAAGHPAPAFTTETLAGGPEVVAWSNTQKPRWLLLFALPSCPICEELVPDFATLERELSESYEFRWVERRAMSETAESNTGRGLDSFRLTESTTFERLDIRASPFAYIVGNDGIVLERGLINSIAEMRDMIRKADNNSKSTAVETPATR